MTQHILPLTAAALLLLSGCSRDVQSYQENTDEAKTKLGECLKLDNPKADDDCPAASAALKKNVENTVNNLVEMGQ